MTTAQTPRTFADHVADYAIAGWTCVLPVPPATKTPPPVGFTGAEGRDTDPATLVRLATEYPGHSIALRMPWYVGPEADAVLPGGWCVVGIDVDQYQKAGKQKHGAETLACCEQRWGPLVKTWTSTARGEGPSRIHLFRAPARRYATRLVGDGGTGDVEVIQRHHRYAVVWPSHHSGVEGADDATYTWYDPEGRASERPPRPDELAWLPPAWVDGLTEGAAGQSAASADRASGQGLLDQLLDDWRPECADMTSARLQAVDKLQRADEGSRHDAMVERTHHLVQLAAGGHPGVAHAVLALRDAWAALTVGEDREEEFERALLTSARKAVTTVGAAQVPNDPCLLFAGGRALPSLAPGDPRMASYQAVDEYGEPVELQIYTPPRWAGIRELIGAHTFDPAAGLDQPLAEAVLERMYPALRYAYDSKNWLLRAPNRWELREDLAPWAITEVARLMPVGDPTAEKGSDPFERSKRRARFMTSAGAGAVAKMMRALVQAGTHPATIALSDLDADPDVLWAGGMPYSIRDSLAGPAFAQVDVSTPHMHTAAVVPEVRPTPLWDAFLEAVWPDPAIRSWALRVLSVAFTGHSARELPILMGETGRGKTQVIHLLMSVLDTYAHAANPKLLAPNSNEHDAMKYDLKGRRLSFIDEGPSDGKAGQERLKQLSGGGAITGRQMNQNPVTFQPTHTLVMTTNDPPHLVDPAVRSRVRLIPCDGDPELVKATRAALGHPSGAVWRAEAPGVLAAMMAEAAAWLADPSSAGLGAAPDSIRYLAETIGAEQDPITVWVTEETEPYEAGTPSRELYQAFTASCLRNNTRRDQIPTETKWGRQLTLLGFPSFHTEHGKRRQLRVSSGGFLPGMDPAPTPTQMPVPTPVPTVQPTLTTPSAIPSGQTSPGAPGPAPADGYDGSADGSLNGLGPNPSSEFAQVNPSASVDPDELTGSKSPFAHEKEANSENPQRTGNGTNPVSRSVGGPASKPASKPRPRQTAKASESAAAKREAARLEKVAAAAGASVALPAVVARDGGVHAAALADVDALLEAASHGPAAELTVDVETTGYPVGHEHFALRTIQLGNEFFAVVLDAADAEHRAVAARHLGAAPVLHAHSATADLVPLAVHGVVDLEDAWARMHDTVVTAKLADPRSTGSDPGLKKLAKAMLGDQALTPTADAARAELFKAGKWLIETKVTTPLEKSGWAQVDPGCETMVRYAASDVVDDAALARRIPAPEPAVLERERLAQRMTARVAAHGLAIDGDRVEQLLHEHRTALAEHHELIRASTAHLGEAAIQNPGSDLQVGAALLALGAQLPRTKTGRPSVAEGVLTPLRRHEGTPAGRLAAAVLGYRKHETAIGLFLEPYEVLVKRGDGRARPTVYTLAADTGRMSCVRPNLQQVPREGGFRACITADPGHLLVSADFASVELRVAAALSGDANLRDAMVDPARDPHWEMARLAFGPQATKADRYAVKRGVFGRIYGGGVGAIARGVGVEDHVAQAIIDALDASFPTLAGWSRMVRDAVEAGRTQFRTYAGRVVYLDQELPHKAPNYCIQGTARELLIDALVRWSQTRWGQAVLLPVHDELVVMVPEAEAADAQAALLECMTSDLLGVPIVAEADEPSFEWKDSA